MTQRYVVSQYVSVSFRDGEVQIATPVSGETYTTGDASVLGVLAAFATPRAVDSIDAREVVDAWIAARILVDADAPEPAALQHWDRESLALHVSSRHPAWRKAAGHATPAVAPRLSATTIPLAPARAHGELAALLGARRSRRRWRARPIAFAAFSDLLWLSARNRADDPRNRISRPYPSGGAAYSLEVYPIADDGAVESLDSGVYRYLPEAHALELLSPFTPDYRPFLVAAGQAMEATPAPVAIVITSRYARQSEEYGPIAYSLVLKEVGCLFQTLYLAAESLGLAACALGGGAPPGLLADLCETTELEEPVVGEFAIGVAAD